MERFTNTNDKQEAKKTASQEKRFLAGRVINASVYRSNRPTHSFMAFYFLWICDCGAGNIAHNGNRQMIICHALNGMSKTEIEEKRKEFFVFSHKKAKRFRSRVDWCRSCSMCVYLITPKERCAERKEVLTVKENRTRDFISPPVRRAPSSCLPRPRVSL